MLKPQPVAGGDRDACMNAEAGNRGAAPGAGYGKVFNLDRIANLCDASARFGARCDASADGSAVEFCQHWLAPRKQITLISAGVLYQTALPQKPGDTAADTFGDPGNIDVAWRGNRPECKMARVIYNIDPVQGERMEMYIEIQGIPEALHESNSAAARLTVRCGNACAPADRSEHGADKNLQNIPEQASIVGKAIS
jgi:hypothetical protein